MPMWGAYFREVTQLQEKHELIGDVARHGTDAAIELVKDRKRKSGKRPEPP